MALQLRVVFAHRRLFRRERVFRDRMNPFDRFDEREMLERYRFGKEDLWKINDEMLGGDLVKAEKLSQTTTLLPNKLTLNKMNSAPKGSSLKPSLNGEEEKVKAEKFSQTTTLQAYTKCRFDDLLRRYITMICIDDLLLNKSILSAYNHVTFETCATTVKSSPSWWYTAHTRVNRHRLQQPYGRSCHRSRPMQKPKDELFAHWCWKRWLRRHVEHRVIFSRE